MRIREKLRWFLAGIGTITIFPTLPEIEFGDVGDDWKAVGDDIRSAIANLNKVDATIAKTSN